MIEKYIMLIINKTVLETSLDQIYKNQVDFITNNNKIKQAIQASK